MESQSTTLGNYLGWFITKYKFKD